MSKATPSPIFLSPCSASKYHLPTYVCYKFPLYLSCYLSKGNSILVVNLGAKDEYPLPKIKLPYAAIGRCISLRLL